MLPPERADAGLEVDDIRARHREDAVRMPVHVVLDARQQRVERIGETLRRAGIVLVDDLDLRREKHDVGQP